MNVTADIEIEDGEILDALCKGRDRCRQLLQVYQDIRNEVEVRTDAGPVNVASMDQANGLLTQMLDNIHRLPRKPSRQIQSCEMRAEAEGLLREIGELLERAMVAEREYRESRATTPGGLAGSARVAAMRSYQKG